MNVLQRRVYCGALLLWVASIVVLPTWEGRSYMRHHPDAYGNFRTEGWHKSGAFGLEGSRFGLGTPFTKIGPLWNPPHNRGGWAVVRWPFQSVEKKVYADDVDVVGIIEFSWLSNAVRLSLGLLALGVLLRIWRWWTEPQASDPVFVMAWSLSLWQAIAWPCMVFSGSWYVSGVLAAAILMAGVLAGVIYGLWSARVHATGESRSITMDEAAICEGSDAKPERADRKWSPISGLMWFVLGLIIGLCWATTVGLAGISYRGPIMGRNTLMGPIYANDPFYANIRLCLATWTVAWLLAFLLRRKNAPRALSWGIVLAAMPLGLIFSFS
jgi:hypothetical protein